MNRPAEIRPASRDTRRAPELREWRCQCGHLLLRLGDGPTPLIEIKCPKCKRISTMERIAA